MIPNRARENNIKMFQETMKLYHDSLKTSDNLVENEYFPVDRLLKLILPKTEYPEYQIKVSNQKSFEMARPFSLAGKKVCVLNFASATNPGGGVENGANAQEEDLCRCSTLYPFLIASNVSDYYKIHREAHNPLYDDACIYTSNVTVIRDDKNGELLTPSEYYVVDIITCAAPNLRLTHITNQQLYELHKQRAKRILDIAAYKNADVVILGAFGCGAFKNDPEVVARTYKDILKYYQHTFETICFAVYDTQIIGNKYDLFKKVIIDF